MLELSQGSAPLFDAWEGAQSMLEQHGFDLVRPELRKATHEAADRLRTMLSLLSSNVAHALAVAAQQYPTAAFNS